MVNTRSFEIKTPDVSIKFRRIRHIVVENRMIEGRPCIVIAINEHVEINGITVRPVLRRREVRMKMYLFRTCLNRQG
mgnify:CR=1 FL=1